MAEETLKQKTAKGLFWGFINNGTQQLLNLFFGIFLARLLTPADYGMVGMLTIFSLIAGSLQESGFISALANKKEITHDDYNAVFWFSITVSFCLYWILFFCAPLIADFYNQPELIPLARYSFLGFFIASLGVIPGAYVFRNLMVKQKALATVLALIFSGTTGVLLAYNGFSYWGIATQSIVYITVLNLYLWYKCPWRPTWRWNFTPVREMLGFSSKLLFTNIFNHVNNNIFSIILGRYYSEKEVGQYNQANKWNYMGFSLISGMVGSVAQPIFAQMTDDSERQVRAFRKMLRFTAFISFPCMLGLSLVAPELITIAITDKWIDSARILQLLAIWGAFFPIANLYSNLLISRGKSDIYLRNTVTLGILQLIAIYLLRSHGIFFMVSVYVGINICWLLVWHYFVQKEIDLPLSSALKDILPYLGIAGGVMFVVWFLTQEINNIYLQVCSKIVLAALFYVVVMWCSGAVTFRESFNYVKSKKKQNG